MLSVAERTLAKRLPTRVKNQLLKMLAPSFADDLELLASLGDFPWRGSQICRCGPRLSEWSATSFWIAARNRRRAECEISGVRG